MKSKCLIFSTALILISGCYVAKTPTETIRKSNPAGIDMTKLTARAAEIVSAGLSDNDPIVRTHAIEVVSTANAQEFMPEVTKLLKDEFSPVRFAAAVAIGDIKFKSAISNLKPLLEDENPSVCLAASYALARLGHKSQKKALLQGINSDNQTLRANSVLLIGKFGDKSMLNSLNWALKDPQSSATVRFQAVEAIAMLGDEEIYTKIWAMLISTYADDRAMGVRAMGALSTQKAKNAIISSLRDPVVEVQLAAAEQLGKLGDKTGELEVMNYFKKPPTSRTLEDTERQDVLAALAIGRIATNSVITFLPDLLKNRSKSVRLAAAESVLFLAKKPFYSQ